MHAKEGNQGQGRRLAGTLPVFRLTLGMHHALGVPPDGVGPFRAQAFAFGPSDGLRPHSRHLTRPLAPNTVPSSQQQGSRLSRILTCPETLHHHSPGMNGTLGPRARWARSDRAFAAYPQSLRSFRYSTTLSAQRPYAPRRMVMQGSRGKDGRGSRVPATEQPRVLRTLESARLRRNNQSHGRKGCEIRERCGFGFETESQSTEEIKRCAEMHEKNDEKCSRWYLLFMVGR